MGSKTTPIDFQCMGLNMHSAEVSHTGLGWHKGSQIGEFIFFGLIVTLNERLVVPWIANPTKGGKAFSYLAPKLWNSLPDNVQGFRHTLYMNAKHSYNASHNLVLQLYKIKSNHFFCHINNSTCAMLSEKLGSVFQTVQNTIDTFNK